MSKNATKPTAPSQTSRVSDLVLTRRTAAGDKAAARKLIYRLMSRVHTTCEYLARGNDGADLAQTALVEIVRSAGSFREESTLEYWADRITVRTAGKIFAKRDRRRRIRETVFVPGPEVIDAEQQTDLYKVRARLTEHLLSLSENQRIVVVLHYLYEYEVSEISDLLGARVNTVRSRLVRGLKRLRPRILQDPGLTEWLRKGKQ
jgi:RNA polymerase sigma-70 factor (ECF subfamily)